MLGLLSSIDYSHTWFKNDFIRDKSYCDPLEPCPIYLSYLYAKISFHKNKGVSSKSVTGHTKKFTFLFPSVNVISTTDRCFCSVCIL